jgi:hypothetical protein
MSNLTKLPVQVKSVHLFNHRLDSFYPVIGGVSDKEVQRKINHTILRTVYALMKEQGYFENETTTITASYEIKNNQRGILSLSLINYAFSGGAHGLTLIRSLTFNTETGKLYRLKDLFKPDADYVARLSMLVEEQIRERDIPLLGEFSGIRPDQDFYIADKSLVLYFQLYEITPYVYGFPYFPISVYDIQDIIDEKGPLGQMLGSF